MTTPPDFVFPELGEETATGESYYSGNKVFTYDDTTGTWTETDKPADT